jgi:hypothetical protein
MSKPEQPDQPPQPRHIARAGRPEQPETWGAPRSKVVTLYDQAATVAGGAGLSGLDFMHALMDGKIPPPPIALLLNMRPTKVDRGLAVFECTPDESVYNPIGLVHGVWYAHSPIRRPAARYTPRWNRESAIPRSTSPSTTSGRSPWPAPR